jgi:hypothetical protein
MPQKCLYFFNIVCFQSALLTLCDIRGGIMYTNGSLIHRSLELYLIVWTWIWIKVTTEKMDSGRKCLFCFVPLNVTSRRKVIDISSLSDTLFCVNGNKIYVYFFSFSHTFMNTHKHNWKQSLSLYLTFESIKSHLFLFLSLTQSLSLTHIHIWLQFELRVNCCCICICLHHLKIILHLVISSFFFKSALSNQNFMSPHLPLLWQ